MKKTFLEYLTDTLEHESILELAQYGADAGWSGLTYTADCVLLYGEFEDEIWDALRVDAEDRGFESVCAYIHVLDVNDMSRTSETFKHMLVWYMAEREAQRYADACRNEEEAV